MMDSLRTAANSFTIKIVFIIIILSLIFMGVSGYLISDLNDYAAKVNGVIINQIQLQKTLQQEKQALEDQLGDKFIKIANSDQGVQALRRQALEHLIELTLINQYSNQLGLTVSDNQIKHNIYNMQIFQIDGNFNKEKYRTILYKNNIKADDFAKEIRQNLINRQFIKMYIKDEFVLPVEVMSYAKLLLQKREIKTITLPLSKYQYKQTVTNKELEDYYNANIKKFISPEQVQVSYIKLDASSKRKNIIIKDEELKKYYNQNIVNFTKPEQKHYSMIELKTKEEANYVFKALYEGADFKKLATEKSTDIFGAKNHGAIGWMEASSTPSELMDANLTKKGQISKVIKLSNNYVIFRLDDIKPEVVKIFQSVKSEIANTLKNEKAINEFYSLQQDANRASLDNHESLRAVEKVTNIKSVKTRWFSRNNIPEEIKFDQVVDNIFAGNLMDKNGPKNINSGIINVDGDRAFIIRVDKYKPEIKQSFDKVKKIVTEFVKLNKSIKEMESDGIKILNVLKQKKDKEILKKLDINFSDIKTIERFGENNLFTEQIFQMPIPKKNIPTYISAKDSKDNLVIIKLIKVIKREPTSDEVKFFSKHYKMILGNIMMESQILNLRDRAKIDLGKFNKL
ncbi:MAG: peptidylprolyl isomerase [Arsenophonus sp.]